VVETAARPEAMNALRNLLVLGKLLGRLSPAELEDALGEGEGRARHAPPSLFSLAGRANTADARRGLEVATRLLGALGAATRRRG
jgi:hypothetical protein